MALRANQSWCTILPTSLPAHCQHRRCPTSSTLFFNYLRLLFCHVDNLTALLFWLFARYRIVTGQSVNKEKDALLLFYRCPPTQTRPSTQVSSFAFVCSLNSVKLDYFLYPSTPPLFLHISVLSFISIALSFSLHITSLKGFLFSSRRSLSLQRYYRLIFFDSSRVQKKVRVFVYTLVPITTQYSLLPRQLIFNSVSTCYNLFTFV